MKLMMPMTAAAAILIASCAPKSVEPVHNLDSQAAGSAITADVHSNARGFHISGDAAFVAPCYAVLTTAGDADADHLPDSPGAAVTYTNCSEGNATYSGTGFVLDGNSAVASFDFTNAVDLDVSVVSSSLTYHFSSAQTGSQSGSTFTLTDSATVDATKTAGEFVGTWHDAHSWSGVFTPDDGTYAPAPGLPLEAGDLTISGGWQLDQTPSGGTTVSVSGAMSGTFRTDPACASAIVSGSAQVVLANSSILHVTWTGCGATHTELQAF